MTTCLAPAHAPRPTIHPHPNLHCRLSDEQLERVIGEVLAVDIEQGLAACFAVADAVGLSPDTHIRNVSLPAWQWLCIAAAVAIRAEALVSASSPEVLKDWDELGPRVAPQP